MLTCSITLNDAVTQVVSVCDAMLGRLGVPSRFSVPFRGEIKTLGSPYHRPTNVYSAK